MAAAIPDTLTAARQLHAAGMSVLPVRADGTKQPRGPWKVFQTQRANETELTRWFADGHPGIGVVTGTVSGGLQLLEFEGLAVAEGILDQVAEIADASGLGDVWRRLATGWLIRSPSGGLHMPHRVTGTPIAGNTKLASRLARADELTDDERELIERHPAKRILRGLIETRGEGGYFVTAPSHGTVHPTGRPYQLLGGGPDTCPILTAGEAAALLAICRMVHAVPEAEDHVRAAAEVITGPAPAQHDPAAAWLLAGGGDRQADDRGITPGDDFEQRTTWDQILTPHGWTKLGTITGTTYWRRPGKTDPGPSATTGRDPARDRLYVFSTSTEFDAERPYTKFGAWTLLNHRGDHSAAARELRHRGYGTPAPVRHLTAVPTAPLPATDGTAALHLDQPPTDAPNTPSGLLPDTFWAERRILTHLRQAAHARACSADVVFYSFLARYSGMLSHHIRAETGIGSPASLNLFAAAVGGPGAGKSAGASVARELLPPTTFDFLDGLPVGSGEGIAEAYMGVVEEETGELHKTGPKKGDPVTVRVRKQVRHNAFFYMDEGEQLSKLGQRNGATLGETLRRAAVGETLGQTNASEDRKRYVAAGSYSMGLLVGFQPSAAMPVLQDSSTGTPQRFLWAWATDPAIPDEPTEWPGLIDDTFILRRPADTLHVAFPASIRRMLWAERVGRNRGEIEVGELDGHASLMQVKLAALFALLEGRTTATEDDWRLAGTVWESSCAVRDVLLRRARAEAEAERQRTDDAKLHQELRTHEAKAGADLALERVARLVQRHASQVGGITYGYLKRQLASRDRGLMERAADLAVTRGWVYEEGDRICVKTD